MNQVQRDFNGLGQMTSEWQEHTGAKTESTLRVQYAYSFLPTGSNNSSRLTKMTDPNGKEITYNYGAGVDANISRLSNIGEIGGALEVYDYLGLGTAVKRGRSGTGLPSVNMSYVKLGSEDPGDAGDQYTGLDRFGRVVDQRWLKTTDNTTRDRYKYSYDRDSNRLYRTNEHKVGLTTFHQFDELYHANVRPRVTTG